MRLRVLFAFLVLVTAWSEGCGGDGSDCDPGQVVRDNLCVAATTDAGVMDGAGDATASDDARTDGGNIAFGKACATSGVSPECTEPAPYCAIQAGSANGYCTATDCKTDASKCPATWTCFDVSVLNFCLKP